MKGPEPGAYDPVAAAYADKYGDELKDKPFDRLQLELLAQRVRPGGLVADLGCGPGHVGGYLAGLGLAVAGYDISEGMLAQARAAHPGIPYQRLDFLNFAAPPKPWAGAVAAYSLIHVPRERLAGVLESIRRGLEPGAPLLASFHQGSGSQHAEAMLGRPVSVDFHFYGVDELASAFRDAGFRLDFIHQRDPYPGLELQPRRRAYLLGRA